MNRRTFIGGAAAAALSARARTSRDVSIIVDSKDVVAKTAPAQLRGTAFGLFNLLTGIVTLVASIIAGALWDRVGATATFYASAAFSLCTIALLLLRGGRLKSV